jgi:heme/copper-type cytochrome/quinol oxidase subunit 1
MKNPVIQNLLFWLAAIGFPIFARSLPTSSGAPPKIYEVLIPLIQIMFAFGSSYVVSRAMTGRSDS